MPTLHTTRRFVAGCMATMVMMACTLAPALGRSVDEGRFGRAIALRDQYASAPHNPIYTVVPLTVELWVTIGGDKSKTAVLLSNEPRNSVTHWELYADQGTGCLAASLPGFAPADLKSSRDITDGKWHYVAMIYDGTELRLAVDGQEVAKQAIKKVRPYPDTGPLLFGHIDGVDASPDVTIDEVRLSRVVRDVSKTPDAPFTNDADTIGLWHFDETAAAYAKGGFADASGTNNPAKLVKRDELAAPNAGFDGTKGGKTRWGEMDFGPFFSSTLLPAGPDKANVTNKAISIRLGGKDGKHFVAFDTELLRWTAGWTGEFLKIPAGREGLSGPPTMGGTPVWQTPVAPGWAKPGSNGKDFTDPRPDRLGPLQKEWGRYKGLYLDGNEVVVCYTVAGADVHEFASLGEYDKRDLDGKPFARRVVIGPSDQAMAMVVCDVPGADTKIEGGIARLEKGGVHTLVACHAFRGVAELRAQGGRIELHIPPHKEHVACEIPIAAGNADAVERFLAAQKFWATQPRNPAYNDVSVADTLRGLASGGAPRYQAPLITQGQLAPASEAPYVVDTLTAPDANPWNSFLRFGGLDFFKNGDMAVCSVSGDVWVVSGIDEKLEQLKWRRYATGLFQPLGLKIVDDQVYVLGRDQITRLHDLNADGEADFYENFNNDGKTSTHGHAYVCGLETDAEGNFYYIKCADGTRGNPHGGTILRVSRDGSKLDVFATGVRNANGLGASPHGLISFADNQGDWVPASRLDFVSRGEFLGYRPMAHRDVAPTDPGKPVVWMPQNVDNSSGGQVWVESEKWGPLKERMLHTSYGAASLLLCMTEEVGDATQGGVVRFPLDFSTGIMRGRFRKADGQLYVCGLKGWQTRGTRDGVVHRVRYTGKPVRMPSELHVHQNGIRIGFTCPLDRATAEDADSYSLLQWNYKWASEYGSKHWSVKERGRQGYDTLAIKSAKLLPDGKSVFLDVPGLGPVMQMKIGINVDAADGETIKTEVYSTVHALNPAFALAAPAGEKEQQAKNKNAEKRILLIAGKKSHGPGAHEYEKGCRLLKHCLETSPNLKNVKVDLVADAWPEQKFFDEADAIFLFCDGSDRDAKAHPLLEGDRLAQLGKAMDRGCGLVCMHYTVFVPAERGGKQFLEWLGGHFDYDSTGNDRKKWYSQLGHATTTSTVMTPDHPTARGIKPFTTKTEYYWKMRWKENDDRITPILTFDPAKAAAPVRESVVAWAVQRKDGGRGFGFTEGHFHSNWEIDSFRRLILNALVWTAGGEVPEGGVDSTLPEKW